MTHQLELLGDEAPDPKPPTPDTQSTTERPREPLFPSAQLMYHALDEAHGVWLGALPQHLIPTEALFETLWDLHPEAYHKLKIHGRVVPTPRWQQAYGKNYRYTGALQNALPTPELLAPYLQWCQAHLDAQINGLLLNWYDGGLKHYIGAHRDDTRDLIEATPIVTISFGQERLFRMRPWKQRGFIDLPVSHGELLVIPWDTNRAWTHEVPHFARYTERRISVTARAFV
ncbi:MAG: alpha-ketoglutarate-dependent dioxygenase AlkB [Myxococcota bacterium]